LVTYSDPEQRARRKRLRTEGMLNKLISFGYSVRASMRSQMLMNVPERKLKNLGRV
jgi:hypothetical protein